MVFDIKNTCLVFNLFQYLGNGWWWFSTVLNWCNITNQKIRKNIDLQIKWQFLQKVRLLTGTVKMDRMVNLNNSSWPCLKNGVGQPKGNKEWTLRETGWQQIFAWKALVVGQNVEPRQLWPNMKIGFRVPFDVQNNDYSGVIGGYISQDTYRTLRESHH